jgi:hypothetical protein
VIVTELSTQTIDQIVKLLGPDGDIVQSRMCGGYVPHPQFQRCLLIVTGEEIGRREYISADLFWCLADFRREFEPKGWRVLCNGARRTAWPSGICGGMGAGTCLYLLHSGSITDSDLINTFDEAPVDTIATFEEQQAWMNDFFASDGRTQAGD